MTGCVSGAGCTVCCRGLGLCGQRAAHLDGVTAAEEPLPGEVDGAGTPTSSVPSGPASAVGTAEICLR